MTNKKMLLSGAAFGVLSLALAAPVAAQETAPGSQPGANSGNVIIVSARKRDENLQDVPIAITALSSDALEEANAYGLEDVAELTPGMQFRQVPVDGALCDRLQCERAFVVLDFH